MKRRAIEFAVLGTALFASVPAARAEAEPIPVHPALNDRFYIGVGLFLPKTSTTAQLNSTTLGIGTDIDFEQALGLQTQKGVPDVFVRVRFSERWRVEAEYFQLNRSGDRVLDREVQWGDHVFPISTQVSSKFDFADTRISVGYSVFKTQDKELGVGFGFHVASYDASLSAAAVGTQGGDVLAPLPVFSIYGQFALTDRWAVGSRFDRFSLSYDQYDGSITSVGVDLMYQPFKHVGFGVAFRSLSIDLESTNSGWTGKIEQTFQGPLFYMTASF